MRSILALAVLSAMAAASAAGAETWTPYTTATDKGLQWSYDTDYSYRDAASGKIVVLQAIGKAGATPRMGPSAPGASDGVGSVMGVDCKAKTLVTIGSYAPSKPLVLSETWRDATPKKADGADNKALIAAVCVGADKLPAK